MIKKVQRKSLIIRESGRSSDYITPSFGHGCLFKCAYCYMRRHKAEGLTIATNTDKILQKIKKHYTKLGRKLEPNQTHEKYWSYDISCNEDFALHAKHHNWRLIFTFFRQSPFAMGTFATKYVNRELLSFNPKGKIRIRFSLMPQEFADVLEPNTSKIIDRIKAVDDFVKAGYDVHLNFSPVIVHADSGRLYSELFQLVNENISDQNKPGVKAEVIFLTHNQKMHQLNLVENPLAEKLLWTPEVQEEKTSEYGGNNLRYNRHLKSDYISSFKRLHSSIIPWNKIRYIF